MDYYFSNKLTNLQKNTIKSSYPYFQVLNSKKWWFLSNNVPPIEDSLSSNNEPPSVVVDVKGNKGDKTSKVSLDISSKTVQEKRKTTNSKILFICLTSCL